MIFKRISKALTRSLSDFNRFLKDFENVQLISKGFDKELNGFPKDSELIWQGIEMIFN